MRKKVYTKRYYRKRHGTSRKGGTVSDYWANKAINPDVSTGWKKGQKPTTRRAKLLDATDKRKKMHDRYVEAGRRIQAIANVTKDKPTKKKAGADARYFFRRAKGHYTRPGTVEKYQDPKDPLQQWRNQMWLETGVYPKKGTKMKEFMKETQREDFKKYR